MKELTQKIIKIASSGAGVPSRTEQLESIMQLKDLTEGGTIEDAFVLLMSALQEVDEERVAEKDISDRYRQLNEVTSKNLRMLDGTIGDWCADTARRFIERCAEAGEICIIRQTNNGTEIWGLKEPIISFEGYDQGRRGYIYCHSFGKRIHPKPKPHFQPPHHE